MTPPGSADAGQHEASVLDDPPIRADGAALARAGIMLAIAMTAANGGNYLLNLLLGRWLSPAEFADANLMVTLMLLVTAIALSLQLVTAKFAGQQEARGTADRGSAIADRMRRVALIVGVATAVTLGVPAAFWSRIFQTESAWPFVILAVGMPCYLLQAVGRGTLQGLLRFRPLSMTFVVEMVVRVGVAVTLVAAGWGVAGATVGLTASFVATWAFVERLRPRIVSTPITADERRALRAFVAPVALLLLGQIVINNGDVLISKSSFEPAVAGVYAAIALMGRAVFFVSWSAVSTIFPAIAQREEAGERSDRLLLTGVAVVAGACGCMVIAAAVFGDRFFVSMFGSSYAGVGDLLVRYAIATSLFAVVNLIVTARLSAGIRWPSWLLLAGAGVQTLLLLLQHDTMRQLIDAQLISMAGLLVIVVVVDTVGTLARNSGRSSFHSRPTSARLNEGVAP